MPLDEARDDSRPFCLLDKVAQESKPGGVFLWGADCLLDRGELPLKNARARNFRGDIDETGTQPGIGIHLLVCEGLDCGISAVELQQFALPEVVFEPEAVSA